MEPKGHYGLGKSLLLVAILLISSASLLSMVGHTAAGQNDGTILKGTIFVVFEDGTELPINDVSPEEQPDVRVKVLNLHTGEVYSANVEAGSYNLNLNDLAIPGGYTHFKVYAEAEGYYDNGRAHCFVDLKTSEINEHDLYLRKLPEAVEVKGYIKDNDTGKGLTKVKAVFYNELVKKEYSVSPTNSTGMYKITLYKGDYDLRVIPTEVPYRYVPYINNALSITDDTKFINVSLERNDSVVIMWTVKGKVVDEDDKGIEANAYLVDMDRMTIASRDLQTDYFSLKVYPGNFALVVTSPGYVPFVKYAVEVGEDTKTMDLGKITLEKAASDEERGESVVFAGDLTTATVTYSVKLMPYSTISGLEFSELGDLRLMIDLQSAFYNGSEDEVKSTIPDGMVDSEEASLFAKWVKNVLGYPRINTEDYIMINGTYYNVTPTGNISIEGLEDTAVEDTTPVYINYTWDLEAVDSEKLQGKAFNVAVKNLLPSETLTMEFDDDVFEVDNGTIDSASAEKTDVAKVKIWDETTFTILKKEAPEIKAIRLEYNQSGDEVKTLKDGETYIVKNGTEVKLHANVFDSVDNPEGGEDHLTYTWSVKGPDTYSKEGNDAVINFTTPGEYNITLSAVDTSNEKNESYATLLVDAMPPALDISKLQFTPQPSGGKIYINESDATGEDVKYRELKINATMLRDSDDIASKGDTLGQIENVVWKYDSDTSPTNGFDVVLRWKEPGEYDLAVNLTDAAGHTTEVNLSDYGITIVVQDRTPPTPKVMLNGEEVNFAVEQKVNVSEEVTFNASGSFDLVNGEQKDVSSYSWRIVEEESGEKMNISNPSSPVIKVTFPTADTKYIVSLTLGDQEGNEISRNFSVSVKGPNLEVEYVNLSKSNPTEGDTIKVTAKVNNTGDAPAHDVVVTCYIVYDGKEKKVKSVPIPKLNVSESEVLTFEIKNVEFHNDVAVKVTADSPDLPQEMPLPEGSKSLKVNKKELLPPWAIAVIIIVVLIVLVLGYYLYLKRKEEQMLLEKARKKRGKGKKREEEEEE